jgi:alpha-tubulin suppressor-like RCC1 family protein
VVSAGDEHTCGRRANGRLYCWGGNSFGKLGDGTHDQRTVPTLVAGGITNWTTVSAGYDHTCGRRATGQLYCWGEDASGALGDGPADIDRDRPRIVAGGFTDWVGVDAGASLTCARRANRSAWCWGSDEYGTVGDGGPTGVARYVPRQVAGGHRDWTLLCVGSYHVCGLRAGGRLFCWGYDVYGAVGDGGSVGGQRNAPTAVAGGGTWTTVDAGGYHTCGRRPIGRLYCWGLGADGQRGDDTNVGAAASPAPVGGGATDWTTISTGRYHTCARTTARRVYCWGEGADYRLGRNILGDALRPEEVFGP